MVTDLNSTTLWFLFNMQENLFPLTKDEIFAVSGMFAQGTGS